MPPRARDLAWDGCLNVRDLGGHRTRDGAETRFGAIVRADSVRQLTDEGWAALREYGVRTIVDLRSREELESDPPAGESVEVVHVPFMARDRNGWQEVAERAERAVREAPDAAAATRNLYLVFLEHFRENVGAAVRTVARAPEGAVVVHCAGGKDRTGLLAAFLLHLAGVDEDQIAADYALSAERLRPRHEAWLAAAESEAERARLRRLLPSPAASMIAVFEELRRRYGSVENYLRAAGVSGEELARARARLRD